MKIESDTNKKQNAEFKVLFLFSSDCPYFWHNGQVSLIFQSVGLGSKW